MKPDRPPVQHFAGSGAVLLQGAAVIDVLYLTALGVRDCRRDGLVRPRFDQLLATLAAAGREVRTSGHADVPEHGGSSESEVLDGIGTAEAARMLGLSSRQVRRLATALGARRVAGSLVYDRGAVEAHRLERQLAEQEGPLW